MTLPNSRLIAGRAPYAHDQAVQRILTGLPQANARTARRIVGIGNEDDEIYREVDVFSDGELLHLTARMNTLGFHVARELQSRRYTMVFTRSGKVIRSTR